MATLRKAKCYRKVVRAYTRKSKKRKKGFIKTVPNIKIARFHMGDPKKKFSHKLRLYSKEKVQIRHNAIESCRQIVNRGLANKIGPKGYHMQINVYPHHVLRENKMLSGAHADRLQTGMAHSFGKTTGTAAQLKKDSTIFTINTDEAHIPIAKASLKKAFPRLAGKVGIEIKKN